RRWDAAAVRPPDGGAERRRVTSPILVLATRNPGKIAELRGLLYSWPWQVQSLDDAGFSGQLEEPGTGYVESALAKASAVCDATGLPALAGDRGIEVSALRGWAGPRWARWMGDGATDADRLQGLLDEVARESPDDRRVR